MEVGMNLWDIFKNSTASIFDYVRGVHRYTPQEAKDIEDLRRRLQQEGANLPPDHGQKPGGGHD